MKLTEEQRAVVEIAEGRHLVLAPPGSGKTEILTQRVVAALKRGSLARRRPTQTRTFFGNSSEASADGNKKRQRILKT